MAEYDAIAEDYARNEESRPMKRYAVTPSFFRILGDLNDKSVLDVGCGEGYFTRRIKEV